MPPAGCRSASGQLHLPAPSYGDPGATVVPDRGVATGVELDHQVASGESVGDGGDDLVWGVFLDVVLGVGQLDSHVVGEDALHSG